MQSLFKVLFSQKEQLFLFFFWKLNFLSEVWQSSFNKPIMVDRKALWLNESVGAPDWFWDEAQVSKYLGLFSWALFSIRHIITINWGLFSFAWDLCHTSLRSFGYISKYAFSFFFHCRSETINSGADRLWAGSLVAAWSADVNSFMLTVTTSSASCSKELKRRYIKMLSQWKAAICWWLKWNTISLCKNTFSHLLLGIVTTTVKGPFRLSPDVLKVCL